MIFFDSFTRTINGSAPRFSRQFRAVWIYSSTFSGAGIDVYHNFHNSPSLTASIIPSACSSASGSTSTFEPARATGSIHLFVMADPLLCLVTLRERGFHDRRVSLRYQRCFAAVAAQHDK